MIKHLRFMMAALLMAVFSGAFATETTVTLKPSQFAAITGEIDQTVGDITIYCASGSISSSDIRIYKNQNLVITSSNGNIKKIVFTCTSSNPIGGFADDDNLDKETSTWEGDADEITLSATNKQVRITQMVITYDAQGTVTQKTDPELSFGTTTSFTITEGDDFTPPTLQAPEGLTITYSSSNTAVAEVDEDNGEVTIKGVGTAKITATSEENDYYYAGSATYTIKVEAKPVEPEYNDAFAPEGAVFFDAFNATHGAGGRDDVYSGSFSTVTIVSDETGGFDKTTNCAGSLQCVKFGTGSNNGVLTTKTIYLYGNGTLTFSVAGWGGTTSNTMKVTAEGATITPSDDITLNNSGFFTLTNGEWTDYEFAITEANGPVTITFTGKRGFIDDICVMPEEVVGNTVEYTIPAGGLGTFVCEEALDFSDFADAKAYYSTGLNAQKNCVAVVRIEGAVEANTPIIIEGTGTVNIPVADENSTFADVTGNKLVGSATESTNLEGVNCMIVSALDGKFHPCSGGTLAAGKAYLDVDPSELGANAKLAIEEIDSDPTAISEVKAQESNGAIYNLQGVRVEKAQKGIYIMNGKKVIFK